MHKSRIVAEKKSASLHQCRRRHKRCLNNMPAVVHAGIDLLIERQFICSAEEKY